MISISTANSNQTSAANREITTSAKTVRMKDILGLRKAVKYVENQVTTFNRNLRNPTLWQRPSANSLMQVLTDIDTVSARVKQLTGKIETSSYPHHASKMANLENIKATIDTLSKRACASFNRSQKNMQVMREREDQYLEDRAQSARVRSERRQYANGMINSGRGDELYNGGMVK
ncbi:hypothetical protein [Candidatus Symbiopectobacterium sp. NZEC135]|uniref:hypothetical protein n=1 Tax=Candidatus Symbiopectobacterium sp. NZEC135 TaxID=2820471 RepID=UPI002227F773|nr:hypothetical protein [Candidatus Symbiopectobacterium sp. NZEC135]MCW2478814.1 hypothetical protein [Candidatus Symbiopectobacterium sp. NZEC135]